MFLRPSSSASPAQANPATRSQGRSDSPIATNRIGALTDRIGIELGLHRDMDVWEGDSSSWGYVCGATWTGPNQRTSATFVVGTGPQRDAEYAPQDGGSLSEAKELDNLYHLAMVGGWLEHQFTERFRYVFNFDIMQMEDDQRDDEAFAEVYAFTQSVFYEWSERVIAGARL